MTDTPEFLASPDQLISAGLEVAERLVMSAGLEVAERLKVKLDITVGSAIEVSRDEAVILVAVLEGVAQALAIGAMREGGEGGEGGAAQ